MSSIKFSKSFINKITNKIDPELVAFHQSRQSKSKVFDDSLENFVERVFLEELNEAMDRTELRKIASAKRKVMAKKKSRYYKKCQDMVDTQEWKNESDSYFYRDALTVFRMTGQLSLNGEQYKTFPEMEQEQLRIIKEWSTDPNSKLIFYPGQEKQTPKSMLNNFMLDLTINILKIAEVEYGYDFSSEVYMVVDGLSNQALFANSRETIKKEDLQDGRLEIYRSSDGKQKTVLTFPPDLFDKGSVTLFDAKDMQLLSYLLICWDESHSSIRPLGVRIIDIYHAISGNAKSNPSANQYRDIWFRCYKMWATGFEGYSGDNVTGGRRLISECSLDEANNIIYFVISDYLYDQFTNNKIRKLPSNDLHRLSGNTAKILFYPFMKQRVSAYETALERGLKTDTYPMTIQYETFLLWVNFGNSNKRDNHAAIIEALDEYRDKEIFIKTYKYLPQKRLYYIEFFALSDVEIQDLDFYFNRHDPEDTEEVIEQLSIFTPLLD